MTTPDAYTRWLALVPSALFGPPATLKEAVDEQGRSPHPSRRRCSRAVRPLEDLLREAGSDEPWLERAAGWCWARLEEPGDLHAYGVKCALDFLDRVPDEARANEVIERLRPHLEADGSIPVTGGAENKRLTALTLSERPGSPSRALFTDEQIEADLDQLEQAQQPDGGWLFDFAAWSRGALTECRGLVTLQALATLDAHGCLK
jgi:hypothetical protein